MKQGLLWFDDSGTETIVESISSAVRYFQSKYGYLPKECYVHPSTLVEEVPPFASLKIRKSERVLANHIWLEFDVEQHS